MFHTGKELATLSIDSLSDDALLRQAELYSCKIIPYSPSTLWRKVGKGKFPSPIKVSDGVTAWRVGDIREWQHCPNEYVASRNYPIRKPRKGGGE